MNNEKGKELAEISVKIDDVLSNSNLSDGEKIGVLESVKTRHNQEIFIKHISTCKDCRDQLRMALK